MERFTALRGAAAPMPIPNVNTDALSPSAAGKSTSVDLGALLFANWRYDQAGRELPEFVLNQPPFREAKILVAGPNFGCGSSRERAVWALMKFGIRCVIAPSFADIFQDNAFQNGLLPVRLPPAECEAIAQELLGGADPVMTVDLERCVVEGPGARSTSFTVSPERREALLGGLDEISVILGMAPDIDAFQREDRLRRPWIYGHAASSPV